MTHHFPGDIEYTHTWRARLDATANYAVIVTGASLIIAFSQPKTHYGLILLNTFFVTLFLFIEATRYRHYEWWNYRLQLIETSFFPPVLVPPLQPSLKLAGSLIDNVLHFNPPITLWEAISLRLRRPYLWLFMITAIAWLIKYWLFPTRAASLKEFVDRAGIGPFPGLLVVSLSLACFATLLFIATFTLVAATPGTGKVVPHLGQADLPDVSIQGEHSSARGKRTRPQPGRLPLFLVSIVTSKTDAVGKGLMREFGCDVTVVPGKANTILICTLTTAEIKVLRQMVAREDRHATIHVLGRGIDS